jgi:hypothetical protein
VAAVFGHLLCSRQRSLHGHEGANGSFR